MDISKEICNIDKVGSSAIIRRLQALYNSGVSMIVLKRIANEVRTMSTDAMYDYLTNTHGATLPRFNVRDKVAIAYINQKVKEC